MYRVRRRLGVVVGTTILTAALAACAGHEEEEEEGASSEDALTTLFGDEPLARNGRDEPIAVPTSGTIITDLTQPELLHALEKRGRHIAEEMGAGDARMPNSELMTRSGVYRSIAESISADVAEVKRAGGGTESVVTGETRIFDTGWFRSPYATFELIGVVNRIDRMHVEPGTCGEVRFLYRLAYARGTSFSRMPFEINIVYHVPGGDCRSAASRWIAPGAMSGDAYVSWLLDGPLAAERLTLKQIEVNAQVVRMPSEMQKDKGGHAEYLLRVFGVRDGRAALTPLENTPDVDQIERDPALKAELLAWIRSNVQAIDEGTASMPAKFAAKKVTSFTTFGSARTVNKPFTRLFAPGDIGSATFDGTKLVASPEALLFRLDDMTCTGCHQGATVAGFHFLGRERGTRMNPFNALRTHASAHYFAEQERRARVVREIASGSSGDRFRTTSLHPRAGERAKVGSHCVVAADASKLRGSWTCEEGTSCKALAVNERAPVQLGECLPSTKGFAGLPCLAGTLTDGASPRSDKLATRPMQCAGGAYSCLTPDEGTPGGQCIARCTTPGKMNGPHEICAFGGGARFDECALHGDFSTCIDQEGVVRPSPRTACDEENPCREDYMCQRLEPAKGREVYATTAKLPGYCNPTYFIFQMRLDGHPKPL